MALVVDTEQVGHSLLAPWGIQSEQTLPQVQHRSQTKDYLHLWVHLLDSANHGVKRLNISKHIIVDIPKVLGKL